MKEGWPQITLGELTARRPICYGVLKPGERQSDGVPLLRITDIKNNRLDTSDIYLITEELSREFKRSILVGGEVLLSIQGTIGRVAICPDEYAGSNISRTIALIDPDKRIDRHFLRYCLLSMDGTFPIGGATRASLNIGDIRKLHVPLPPLEEQQRIVAVLDEAFEGLARARAHAEANLQNAQELFESYSKSVFQPHEALENDSESTTVGAVCDIQSGAGFPLKYQGRTSGEYPFYKVSDMNLPGNEWELLEANHYISEEVRLELRARLFPADSIVFPKVGGAIATNKKRVIRAAGCVDNNVMGLIPDKSKVVSEYIHEWLRAFDIYEFSNRANPPSITQGTVSGWPLRVPSKDEQLQVVATATALREQTESLRESYEARLQAIDDLRQSLLQKAFAGELT